MIALDTSALVAIARSEPESDAFDRIISTSTNLIGAPTLVELGIVLSNLVGDAAASDFLTTIGWKVETVPFSVAMSAAAHDAFMRYGRGRHPARLNFGDCMSYAVAKVLDLPLLFKGDDFARTDLRPAYAP